MAWCDPIFFLKQITQLARSQPYPLTNPIDGIIGLLEKSFGAIEAQMNDIFFKRLAGFLAKSIGYALTTDIYGTAIVLVSLAGLLAVMRAGKPSAAVA